MAQNGIGVEAKGLLEEGLGLGFVAEFEGDDAKVVTDCGIGFIKRSGFVQVLESALVVARVVVADTEALVGFGDVLVNIEGLAE